MHYRALPSAFSAFAQYACSYTGNAYCRSHQPNMPCVFTSQRMFGQNFKMRAPATSHNRKTKVIAFEHSLKCWDHQRCQQAITRLHLTLLLGLWGNPMLLCSLLPSKAEELAQRPAKAEQQPPGQLGWHHSRTAGVQLFFSHPTTKAQFLSLLIFFFWVSHASSWLCVCLFWGRTRQQPSQGFKYCRYMPQVGRIWLAGWRGSCLGGGEARGNTDRREKQDGCLWAPRGYYTSSSLSTMTFSGY